MTQALFLATNIIKEEIEEYRCRKKVDQATLLPKIYSGFQMFFLRKKQIHSQFTVHTIMQST